MDVSFCFVCQVHGGYVCNNNKSSVLSKLYICRFSRHFVGGPLHGKAYCQDFVMLCICDFRSSDILSCELQVAFHSLVC